LRRHRQREADQATFEELLDQTRQLISLSQDLLTLASLGVPDSRPSPGSVRITELIERAVEDVESATGVACRVRLDVQDVTIPGSYDDLLRLVRNLLDNAVQYGPSSAVIRVSAECELVQGMLSIAVQDEGPPIPEQIAERIFEPFFRATAVREQPGSGLGLAIAREIAEAHGGSLALDSSADSPRFVVRLPLAERAATSD
jgi:signal transduction histidine kinase